MINVLAVGPYERDNFGDVLFYLVLKHYAKNKDINLVPSSFIYSDMTPFFGEFVFPYHVMLKNHQWDAVWVVGGEVGGATIDASLTMSLAHGSNSETLDSAEKDIIKNGLSSPDSEMAYIPRLDLYPKNRTAKYILNSVGSLVALSKLHSAQEKSYLSLLRQKNSMVSVRDARSYEYLKQNNIDAALCPDVVHVISDIVDAKSLQKSNTLLFQVSAEIAPSSGITSLAKQLIAIAKKYKLKIGLFLAGTAAGHDSRETYDAIADAVSKQDKGVEIFVITERNALKLAEIIAGSSMWIGSSLHGRIIASAYGIPRVSLQKYKVDFYSELWDEKMPFGVTYESMVEAADKAMSSAQNDDAGELNKQKALKNIESIFERLPNDKLASSVKSTDKDFYEILSSSKTALESTSSALSIHNLEADTLRAENSSLKDEEGNLLRQIRDLSAYRNAYYDVIQSRSYRLGRKMMYPPRAAKKIYHITRHKVGLFKNVQQMALRIDSVYKIKNRLGIKRLKVRMIIRSYYHPTSSTFIRLISPFSHKSLQDVSIIKLVDGEKPTFRKDTDIIVVQRTALRHMEDAARLVKHVRDNNIKLFVDTDDAFGELDEIHPQYLLQKERVDALNHIIDNADEVWFSTEELQKLYGIEKSKVIKNTLDAKVWPKLNTKLITPPAEVQPLRIVYMGTATHNEDFEMIMPALEGLYDDMPGAFELYIIGVASKLNERPWITQLKPESGLYPDFVQWFSALPQFDIGLSPLVDSAFNRNKSDIKCLDYLGNGIKPIVSNVEAYKNPELDGHIVRVDNSIDEWYATLKKEIDEKNVSRATMPRRAKKGFDYINKHRSTEIPAKLILSSIEKVEKKKRRLLG